jgi:hypothetical protein
MNCLLNRRAFLRASGVSLALPLLECMAPRKSSAASQSPKRMVFVCTTLGLHPPAWWPKTPGPDYESSEYLDLLKAHRNDYTVFSGLSHEAQTGRQPHNCEMTWLTAGQGPGLDGFRNSISVDQYAAARFGNVTRFPFVTLGSATAQSQSYNSSGVMAPAETSPANLFARLFLAGKPGEVKLQKQKLSDGASILDQLLSQTRSLRRNSGSADKQHLDAYFESVRQAEREITASQAWLDKPKPTVQETPPRDIADKADLAGRTLLFMKMIPLILQTDSSRAVSLMIQDHRVVPKVAGVNGEHHNLSHHGQEESKIEQLKRIEKELVKCFGALLFQMKDSSEGDSNLLERTSVLFGSNLGNANAHDPKNLPILLAGGGYKHGRFIAHDAQNNVPLSNLFLTMLQNSGIETEAFAQSSGSLGW